MNRDSRCSRRRTRRPGSWSGSGRTSAASASVSSRMFTPSPAASDTIATNDTSGWRFSRRAANRRSVTKPLSIRAPFLGRSVGRAAAVPKTTTEVVRRGTARLSPDPAASRGNIDGGAVVELFDHIADDRFTLVAAERTLVQPERDARWIDHPRPRCTPSSIPAHMRVSASRERARAARPAGRSRK